MMHLLGKENSKSYGAEEKKARDTGQREEKARDIAEEKKLIFLKKEYPRLRENKKAKDKWPRKKSN